MAKLGSLTTRLTEDQYEDDDHVEPVVGTLDGTQWLKADHVHSLSSPALLSGRRRQVEATPWQLLQRVRVRMRVLGSKC